MRINNVNDFYHFIRNNGLSNISPDTAALVKCMEEYGRLCTCDPQSVRTSKINQCRGIYSGFLSKAIEYREILLSKISDNVLIICIDGQPVVTLSR